MTTLDLFIDISTGRAVSSATDNSDADPIRLFLRDIVPVTVTFMQNGVNVTNTVLASNATMRVGVKTSQLGSTLLAGTSAYTLSGGVASLSLNLNTAQLLAFFASSISNATRSARLLLEIEVEAADLSARRTYFQSAVSVSKDLNNPTDVPTTDAGDYIYVRRSIFDFRPDITGPTGGGTNLDGVPTINGAKNVPSIMLTTYGSALSMWELVASALAAGPGCVQPLDNAALRWIQLL